MNEKLPGEFLGRAVEFLEALSHEALLQVIQKRLSPEEQDRIAYLRPRNEDEEITDVEHQ